jgi:uncharacterized protein YoxC
MLIALLTVLLLGGGGDGLEVFSKKDRKLVEETVADKDRSAAAVAEMKAAQKRLDGAAKQSRGLIKRWRKMDADVDSGRAELEPMLSEAVEYRSEALKAFADSIFEMRKQLTAEEWAALYPGVEHGG